jgi:hypothetical protein
MKKDHPGISTTANPSGDGCAQCLATGGWWRQLRRYAQCGHSWCRGSSPSQHATEHHASTGHTVVTSFEPGEDWFRLRNAPDDQGRGIAAVSFAPADSAGTRPSGKSPTGPGSSAALIMSQYSTSNLFWNLDRQCKPHSGIPT